MIVVCLEGCHGVGKTELCSRFRRNGFAVQDEAFLDMPDYMLHPQSLLMETTWVCSWFEQLLRRKAAMDKKSQQEQEGAGTPSHEGGEGSVATGNTGPRLPSRRRSRSSRVVSGPTGSTNLNGAGDDLALEISEMQVRKMDELRAARLNSLSFFLLLVVFSVSLFIRLL